MSMADKDKGRAGNSANTNKAWPRFHFPENWAQTVFIILPKTVTTFSVALAMLIIVINLGYLTYNHMTNQLRKYPWFSSTPVEVSSAIQQRVSIDLKQCVQPVAPSTVFACGLSGIFGKEINKSEYKVSIPIRVENCYDYNDCTPLVSLVVDGKNDRLLIGRSNSTSLPIAPVTAATLQPLQVTFLHLKTQ